MLKAELRAKMFQLDPGWASVEDILTGDFFGALDYLPRVPFLSRFLERVVALNETVLPPSSVATRLRAVVQVRKRSGCAP